jgi:Holliday junction resolvase RusA-like endonuclease
MRADEEPLETIEFVVLGEPSPEGSTKAFYIEKLNRAVITHQNQKGLQAWRNRVATEAQRAIVDRPWVSDCGCAYAVDVDFVLSRPPSIPWHRRLHPTVKPDIDKLVRAINDALTGIMFPDDCQVVSMRVSKDYNDGVRPGAYIKVSRYTNAVPKPRKEQPAKKGREKAKAAPEAAEEHPYDDPRDD